MIDIFGDEGMSNGLLEAGCVMIMDLDVLGSELWICCLLFTV